VTAISACPLIPGALKTLLVSSGITVASGPSRKDSGEWTAIGLPRADRPKDEQTFGDWREEGTVPILCFAAVAKAGEDGVDAARSAAWALAETVGDVFDFCEGGDATLGGVVLECGIASVADADASLEQIGSADGHTHTVEVTLRWSARG
jgi:hypothetical protein